MPSQTNTLLTEVACDADWNARFKHSRFGAATTRVSGIITENSRGRRKVHFDFHRTQSQTQQEN